MNKTKRKKDGLFWPQHKFIFYLAANMDHIAAQARVTKQTVYRYFPSKIALFQAMLEHMGESCDESFLTHLKNTDTQAALLGFAKDFIEFHLSDEHIATYRLLVTESANAPEIVSSFLTAGPNSLQKVLLIFFKERFKVKAIDSTATLWTGMLLAQRGHVLMGAKSQVKNRELSMQPRRQIFYWLRLPNMFFLKR